VLSLIGVGAAAGPAHANLLANGGFESPVQSPGGAQTFAPGQTLPSVGPGWTVIGNAGTSIYLLQNTYNEPWNSVSQFNAQEGANSVDLSGPANVGSSAGVRQTVAVTPGHTYVLSFWVGRVTPTGGPGGVYPSAATVDLVVDGGSRLHFTNSNVTNGMINWEQFSYTFSATSTQVSIDFLNGTPSPPLGSNEAGLDGVSLVPAVDVPALPLWGAAALVALLAAAVAAPRFRPE